MVAGIDEKIEDLAHRMLDTVTRFCLAVPRGRRRSGDLKEIEYLTLSLLHEQEVMIVGEIQRRLGVLPAQMSRIIRALETREQPFIACRINALDKRKIDVMATEQGRAAFRDYQALRVRTIAGMLRKLDEADRDDIARLTARLQAVMDKSSRV
jgi:DNA-binding MarR family transcriptional regulator